MTLPAGTRLGPYEVLSPLGAGGMGEVYRARDTKLDRDVAIKVLPVSVASDPEALARFEREAKAVAALSHPNILAIHDFGDHGGITYAVMELLEGETLRRRLDTGPISQRQAVDYALQIAKGLAGAHERGVLHRDLKPDNVIVTKDDHVKILDFGLAKRVETAAPDEATSGPTAPSHTRPGTVMGTMGYMSPEQVRGLPSDHRSDVFSFGTILYELLAGKRAFRQSTASDTMAAILRDEPPELSGSGRNISPALENIVRHCLEKNPDERFQSAKEIVFALSVVSSPSFASGSQAIVLPAGKKRVRVAAAVIIVAALAIAAALLLRRMPTGGGEEGGLKRLAVLPFENLGAPEDDYFADGIADEVRGKLTKLPGLQVIARGSSIPYKKTTKTPQQIARELNVSYLLTGTLRWEKIGGGSRVHVTPELVDVTHPDAPTSKWQQPFDAALTDVFQVQSDIATRAAQALGVALGAGEEKQLSERPTQNLDAYDAFLRGEEATKGLAAADPPSLRRAIAHYEQAVALDPGFAQAWTQLSRAHSFHYTNSVPTPAEREQARAAAERALALAPGLPAAHLAFGDYYQATLGDWLRASEQYALGRQKAPRDADLLVGTALVQQNAGHWEEGLASLRQAQAVDPHSALTARRLARTLLLLRHYAEARETADRGLALAPQSLGILETKVILFLAQGDLEGARSVLKEAPPEVDPKALVAYMAMYNNLTWVLDEPEQNLLLSLSPAAFGDDRVAWGMSLAQTASLRGDEGMVRHYAESARIAAEAQLRDAPEDATRHAFLGLALAFLGHKAEAIKEGERGVALVPVAKDAYDGPFFQHQLARIYILVGEPEKALDQLEPLLKIPYVLSPGWLQVDPNFDPLRNNPRFQKLVVGAK
ncbi:MAG TPA: protein kinase [Thermoanaerobaculia bacterium]